MKMKRALMEITVELADELIAAAGWKFDGHQFDARIDGELIRWRHEKGGSAFTNDASPFPEPMRQAVRARVVSTLTGECPRCGKTARPGDLESLTASRRDRAQVAVATTTEESTIFMDGTPAAAVVAPTGGPAFLVLLHDHGCEAGPARLDELAQGRWN